MKLEFDTRFDPERGMAVDVAPGIRRITANNPSPFTFHGTNSYIVGTETLAVIDPGPDNEAHLQALLQVIGARPVSHIFVSHTHRDHSPLAARLQEATGAPTLGYGPHRPARTPRPDESQRLDASGDTEFQPDQTLSDDEVVEGDNWRLRAIFTPGHCANHMAFALEDTGITFSGDHVMAWATTIVAPPDGRMSDYMASLERLIFRDDRMLLPGHGGPVNAPTAFMRGLRSHRKMRERAILERIRTGDRTIPDIVAAIYKDTDPRLHGAAAMSVLAHIEDLVERGEVAVEGPASLGAAYQPT